MMHLDTLTANTMGLICHRRGSQRLPHKAMQLLDGQPMAARVLQAVNQVLPQTWLFTDDLALQTLSCEYERITLPPFSRPESLSQHHTSTEAVIHYLLHQLAITQTLPKWGLLFQLTSPFLNASHIEQALSYWHQNQPRRPGSMVSVCQPRKPTSWFLQETQNASFSALWLDDSSETRFHSSMWLPNGAIYMFAINDLLQDHTLTKKPVLGFDMTEGFNPTEFDIDTLLEFQLAQGWLKKNTHRFY